MGWTPGAAAVPGRRIPEQHGPHRQDEAVFGQIAFDITDQLELSLGARYFEPETTVKGFFGFGLGSD